MNTPFKRDVVKELAAACHEAKMPLGFHDSPRDWHHPDYGMGDNPLSLPAVAHDPIDTLIRLTLSGPASAEMIDGRPLSVAGATPGNR